MRGGGAERLHHRIRASEGMVTAEFAIGLLAVIPILLSIVLVVGAAAVKVQVVEGARTAARMLARGDAEVDAIEQVHISLPQAQVQIIRDEATVTVAVDRVVQLAGILPDFSVTGTATTPAEAGHE